MPLRQPLFKLAEASQPLLGPSGACSCQVGPCPALWYEISPWETRAMAMVLCGVSTGCRPLP